MGVGDFMYAAGPGATSNPASFPPTGAPSTPTSGINFGSLLLAGRPLPFWKDANGQTFYVQDALWPQARVFLSPRDGATVMVNAYGQAVVTADSAVISHVAPTATSRYTRTLKTTSTSVAAINRGAGFIWNTNGIANQFWRGNAANLGGFFFFCRFGMDTYALGNRLFMGLGAVGTQANWYTAEPSAQTGDYVGLGMDSTDATVTLYTRDGVTSPANKTAIAGLPAPAGSGAFFVDLYLYCGPNASSINFRVDDLVAGTTIVDTTVATLLPRPNILMGPQLFMGSGSVAAGVAYSIASVYASGIQ